EREQSLVGGTVRPGRVDRIAVHRQKVTGGGNVARPEPAILLDVLHVQPDGEQRRLVRASDRRSEAGEPCARRRGGRWAHTVGVLVAEVPRPERLMTRKRSRSLRREQ